MAILTVNPGGGADYTTIAAAISAAGSSDTIEIQANITETVTLNKNIAGIRGSSRSITWDSTGTALGINSGLTQSFTLQTLTMDVTSGGGSCLSWNTIGTSATVFVQDIDFTRTSASTGDIVRVANALAGTELFRMQRCRLTGTGTTDSGFESAATTTADTIQVWNCIFEDITQTTNGIAVKNSQSASAEVMDVYNCTIDNCWRGFESGSDDNVKNCVFTNNTDDVNFFNNMVKGNFKYCAFEQQTDDGGWDASIIFGIDDTEFDDTTDYVPASGSNIEDGGDSIVGFSNDFNGIMRPQGSAWDIGAVERPSDSGFNTLMMRMVW